MIKNALSELTNDGTFHIEKLIYDEKAFGNSLVILSSNEQVDIRFTNDRGIFWCEIGQAKEWYFIEDVFLIIGIKAAITSTDFIGMVTEISKTIKKNATQIFRAFDSKHCKETQSKVRTIAKKRAMSMFDKKDN